MRLQVQLLLIAVLLISTRLFAQEDAATIKDFESRVTHYVSLKSDKGIPNKQTNSPEQLANEKQQAKQKVHEARPEARQGDIFAPAIAEYFKRQIRATLKGPSGSKIRSSLQHAEPLPNLHLAVNAPYPANLPLQSTPPTLLLNLPHLPKGLQYRLAGSTLFLYDENARLVVDFLPGAIT